MNSRDAAYEQEVQMLLEATKAAATAAEASAAAPQPLVASPPTLNGLPAEADEKDRDALDQEAESGAARKKRKRSGDEK